MAFEKVGLIFTSNLIGNIIRVGLSMIVIFRGGSIFEIVMVILFSYLVLFIIRLIMYQKYIDKIEYKINFNTTKELLRNSPSFILLTIVGMVFARVDVLIITKLTDMIQVAVYTAAYKIYELNMAIPAAYVKSSFPFISRLYRNDPVNFQKMTRIFTNNTTHYVIASTIIIIVLSSVITSIFFGNKFERSSAVLQVLMIGFIPWGVSRIYASILTAGNYQRYDLWSTIIAASVNAVLNIILVPPFDGLGAAIANTVSLIIFFLFEFLFVRIKMYKLSFFDLIKPCTAIFLSTLLMVVTLKIGWHIPLIALLAVLTIMIVFSWNKYCQSIKVSGIVDVIKNIIKS